MKKPKKKTDDIHPLAAVAVKGHSPTHEQDISLTHEIPSEEILNKLLENTKPKPKIKKRLK